MDNKSYLSVVQSNQQRRPSIKSNKSNTQHSQQQRAASAAAGNDSSAAGSDTSIANSFFDNFLPRGKDLRLVPPPQQIIKNWDFLLDRADAIAIMNVSIKSPTNQASTPTKGGQNNGNIVGGGSGPATSIDQGINRQGGAGANTLPFQKQTSAMSRHSVTGTSNNTQNNQQHMPVRYHCVMIQQYIYFSIIPSYQQTAVHANGVSPDHDFQDLRAMQQQMSGSPPSLQPQQQPAQQQQIESQFVETLNIRPKPPVYMINTEFALLKIIKNAKTGRKTGFVLIQHDLQYAFEILPQASVSQALAANQFVGDGGISKQKQQQTPQNVLLHVSPHTQLIQGASPGNADGHSLVLQIQQDSAAQICQTEFAQPGDFKKNSQMIEIIKADGSAGLSSNHQLCNYSNMNSQGGQIIYQHNKFPSSSNCSAAIENIEAVNAQYLRETFKVWMRAINQWVIRNESLKKYQLLRDLGKGGQGRVFEVRRAPRESNVVHSSTTRNIQCSGNGAAGQAAQGNSVVRSHSTNPKIGGGCQQNGADIMGHNQSAVSQGSANQQQPQTQKREGVQHQIQTFAVKVLNKRLLRANALAASHLIKEIQIQRLLRDCGNSVKLLKIYESKDYINMIMEYHQGGTLSDLIMSRNYLQEEEVKIIAEQLLLAVDYMSCCGIVHRDLKPENILLNNSKNSKEFDIRIADFGFSCLITPSVSMQERRQQDNIICGTPGYIAPEAINKEGYSQKSDVFSVGSILYSLITKRNLFMGTSAQDVLKANRDCKLDQIDYLFIQRGLSLQGREAMKAMLTRDVRFRPGAKQALLNLPWFAKDHEALENTLAINREIINDINPLSTIPKVQAAMSQVSQQINGSMIQLNGGNLSGIISLHNFNAKQAACGGEALGSTSKSCVAVVGTHGAASPLINERHYSRCEDEVVAGRGDQFHDLSYDGGYGVVKCSQKHCCQCPCHKCRHFADGLASGDANSIVPHQSMALADKDSENCAYFLKGHSLLDRGNNIQGSIVASNARGVSANHQANDQNKGIRGLTMQKRQASAINYSRDLNLQDLDLQNHVDQSVIGGVRCASVHASQLRVSRFGGVVGQFEELNNQDFIEKQIETNYRIKEEIRQSFNYYNILKSFRDASPNQANLANGGQRGVSGSNNNTPQQAQNNGNNSIISLLKSRNQIMIQNTAHAHILRQHSIISSRSQSPYLVGSRLQTPNNIAQTIQASRNGHIEGGGDAKCCCQCACHGENQKIDVSPVGKRPLTMLCGTHQGILPITRQPSRDGESKAQALSLAQQQNVANPRRLVSEYRGASGMESFEVRQQALAKKQVSQRHQQFNRGVSSDKNQNKDSGCGGPASGQKRGLVIRGRQRQGVGDTGKKASLQVKSTFHAQAQASAAANVSHTQNFENVEAGAQPDRLESIISQSFQQNNVPQNEEANNADANVSYDGENIVMASRIENVPAPKNQAKSDIAINNKQEKRLLQQKSGKIGGGVLFETDPDNLKVPSEFALRLSLLASQEEPEDLLGSTPPAAREVDVVPDKNVEGGPSDDKVTCRRIDDMMTKLAARKDNNSSSSNPKKFNNQSNIGAVSIGATIGGNPKSPLAESSGTGNRAGNATQKIRALIPPPQTASQGPLNKHQASKPEHSPVLRPRVGVVQAKQKHSCLSDLNKVQVKRRFLDQ